MLRAMTVTESERIRELKLTAKWGTDSDKRKAVFGLLQHGNQGISAIHEILAVTAYDDVKQACLDAIKSIGRKQLKPVERAESKQKKPSRKRNHKQTKPRNASLKK